MATQHGSSITVEGPDMTDRGPEQQWSEHMEALEDLVMQDEGGKMPSAEVSNLAGPADQHARKLQATPSLDQAAQQLLALLATHTAGPQQQVMHATQPLHTSLVGHG